MKEVFKMFPIFICNQNINIRRMSDDSTIINLLGTNNNDFSSMSSSSTSSSNTIFIFEETVVKEKTCLSKIIEFLGKNISFFVAVAGNITAQMIISSTIAKTPWSKENIINSLKFNGILIASDTLIEPCIFCSIENIENWIIDKWRNNDNNINIWCELIKVISVLLLLSYSGVLLDRASNNLLNNWISMEILGQTSIEFASYLLNMTFYGAIISRLEKVIKLGWKKIKNLFNNNDIDDIENQLLNSEQNSDFFCENILPLFFITPISMVITWGSENYISNQEFTWKKMLIDAPKTIAGTTLSLISSLFNCMINKERIPFLPKTSTVINTIKKWTGCEQNNDIIEQSVTSFQPSINCPCLVNIPNSLESLEKFPNVIEQLDRKEEYSFKKSQLFFESDEESEMYFDAIKNQKIDNNFVFSIKSKKKYGTFNDYCKTTNFLDSGISSSTIKTEFEELLFPKSRSFTI